jgi:hypothetical protein
MCKSQLGDCIAEPKRKKENGAGHQHQEREEEEEEKGDSRCAVCMDLWHLH